MCMNRPESAISNLQPPHYSLSGLNWVCDMCICICKDKKIGKEKKLQPFTTSLPTTKKNGLICMKKYKKKAGIFFKKNTKMTFLQGFCVPAKLDELLA